MCDTILKITTAFDESDREYTLTNLYLTGSYTENGDLRINAEGQMTYPALKCYPQLAYRSENPEVASVDANGVITAGTDGETEITVTGTWKGTEVENQIKVKVKDRYAYVGEELIGAVMHVDGFKLFAELSSYTSHEVALEGRSATGGAVSLKNAEVTYHVAHAAWEENEYMSTKLTEDDSIGSFVDGKFIPNAVDEKTRIAVWADIEQDGQSFTTNRVYMDLMPYENLAKDAEVTASSYIGDFTPDKVVDGKLINGTDADASRWSVKGENSPWIQFDLHS